MCIRDRYRGNKYKATSIVLATNLVQVLSQLGWFAGTVAVLGRGLKHNEIIMRTMEWSWKSMRAHEMP